MVVRLGDVVVILDLYRQGLSVTAIAERVGVDRKTVRKYIERGLETPVYQPRPPRPTKVAPFERYLQDRVTAYPELTPAGCCARSVNRATAAATRGSKTSCGRSGPPLRPATR